MIFLFDFGDVNWRQVEAWNLLVAGVVKMHSKQQQNLIL